STSSDPYASDEGAAGCRSAIVSLASLPRLPRCPCIERVRLIFACFCRVSACVAPAILVEPTRWQDAGGLKCAGTGSGRRGEPSRRLTPTPNLGSAPPPF